jgi:hypothetical protein
VPDTTAAGSGQPEYAVPQPLNIPASTLQKIVAGNRRALGLSPQCPHCWHTLDDHYAFEDGRAGCDHPMSCGCPGFDAAGPVSEEELISGLTLRCLNGDDGKCPRPASCKCSCHARPVSDTTAAGSGQPERVHLWPLGAKITDETRCGVCGITWREHYQQPVCRPAAGSGHPIRMSLHFEDIDPVADCLVAGCGQHFHGHAMIDATTAWTAHVASDHREDWDDA